MEKPISVKVTLTCERCGAETIAEIGSGRMDHYTPMNQGYYKAERKVLVFKKEGSACWVKATYPDNMDGVGVVLICPACCEKWGHMFEKMVFDFNEKVKNFLENKEVSE